MTNGWNAGTSTHLAAPNATAALGHRVFPPNIGFIIPATASWCRVRVVPVPPDFGDPFELQEGFTIQLDVTVSDGRSLSTLWTSFGPDGHTATLPDGSQIVNPPPTLMFPVVPGLLVHGALFTTCIPAVQGIIEWQ